MNALIAKKRSRAPIPNLVLQSATTLATLRWLTMTPLGSPVVPDVYST